MNDKFEKQFMDSFDSYYPEEEKETEEKGDFEYLYENNFENSKSNNQGKRYHDQRDLNSRYLNDDEIEEFLLN